MTTFFSAPPNPLDANLRIIRADNPKTYPATESLGGLHDVLNRLGLENVVQRDGRMPFVHIREQSLHQRSPSALSNNWVINLSLPSRPIIQIVEMMLPIHLLFAERAFARTGRSRHGVEYPAQKPSSRRLSEELGFERSVSSFGACRTSSLPSGNISTTAPS